MPGQRGKVPPLNNLRTQMITHEMDLTKIPQQINRLRVYYLDWRSLIHLLRNGDEYPQAVTVNFCNLPKGARIHNVFMRDSRFSFGIVVEHESFDPVPNGHLIPDGFVTDINSKMFIVVGDDKFACNWDLMDSNTLRAMQDAIGRELHHRRVKEAKRDERNTRVSELQRRSQDDPSVQPPSFPEGPSGD
jgi:hypothetical protein